MRVLNGISARLTSATALGLWLAAGTAFAQGVPQAETVPAPVASEPGAQLAAHAAAETDNPMARLSTTPGAPAEATATPPSPAITPAPEPVASTQPAAQPAATQPAAEQPPSTAAAATASETPAAPPVVTAQPAATAPPSADPAIAHAMARLADSAGVSARQGTRDERAALAEHYSANGGRPLWTTLDGFTARGKAVLAELRQADAYGLSVSAFDLPAELGFAATPEAQAEAEVKVSIAALTYARHARGGRVAPQSISSLIDMRPTLVPPKTVLETITAGDDVGAALRGFHPQHPGFQRLQQALAAARATTTSPDTLQRIVVNMERWRWMPTDPGAIYVWNNIPEQLTRVVENGNAVLTERIVVGKPNTPTPIFSADMLYVIFHPSWGVPEGIKSNEVGPMLRRASANGGGGFFSLFDSEGSSGPSHALARHNLQVYRNGRQVNPDSVDWTRANVREFSFTQPPSGRNVLGIVKFRFPNRHDVYMHDTPERHLFNGGTRAFSHGCMRVQNPMHLAEVLLAHDKGWSRDKVDGFVGRGSTADITLDKPIPVHNTYFTASADESGKLHTHGDVYGMDSRVASALTGKAVHIASGPREVSEAPAAAAPRQRSPRVPTRAARAAQPAQVSFNPFAGLFAN